MAWGQGITTIPTLRGGRDAKNVKFRVGRSRKRGFLPQMDANGRKWGLKKGIFSRKTGIFRKTGGELPEVRCPRSEVRNRGGKQRNERKTRKMGRNQPKTEGELRMDRMARMGTGNGDFTANGREWTPMGTEEGDFQQENRRGIA